MKRLIIIETDDSGKECGDCEHKNGFVCILFCSMLDRAVVTCYRCEACRMSGALSEEIWLQQLNPRKAT